MKSHKLRGHRFNGPSTRDKQVTRYFYLEPVGGNGSGLNKVKFVYGRSKGGKDGGRYQVYFQTPVEITTDQWDGSKKRINSRHPQSEELNAVLDLFHELALHGIEEKLTQDEIRATLDLNPTLAHAQHTFNNRKRQVPAPEPTPAPEPDKTSQEVPEETSQPTLQPISEMAYIAPSSNTAQRPPITTVTKTESVVAEIQLTSDRRFLVNDQVVDDEGDALHRAWNLARDTGKPVTVYELQLVPLGVISPPERR